MGKRLPDGNAGLPVKGEFHYADLLGKEFRLGARGPDAYDCYSLLIEVRKRAGLFIPENYVSTDLPAEMHDTFEDARASFPWILLPGPRPFCLVTFRCHEKYTTHIGMVMPDGYHFIHVRRKGRVCLDRLDSPAWKHRVTGFFEVDEIGPNRVINANAGIQASS